MATGTLYNHVWDSHKVAQLPTGQDQLLIGLHLIHEVTSPQAFAMLGESGGAVRFPDRTFATMDHIVPTENQAHPFLDSAAETMAAYLAKNCNQYGIEFFDLASQRQGIVHVIGPELGLTQPGMTIACGDSHTSTHGAFGSLAFGIGTTEVRYVLETQTLALSPLKVRQIWISGALSKGVYAKDIILKIIQLLGVKAGIGYAYEYAGPTISGLSMEERLTICNMSIEGGARIGYMNPDATTFNYLKGRPRSPVGGAWDRAMPYWNAIATRPDATFDDRVIIDVAGLAPMVTWGITPGQSSEIDQPLPDISAFPTDEQAGIAAAYHHMRLKPGQPIVDTPIDVAFIGSCTNGRLSDLREAAKVIAGRHVAPHVKAIVVPGSWHVKAQAEAEGLDQVFRDAGFEWRHAGCSMCLAMNPDKLTDGQLCASSSNRNFIGRQGHPTGRTVLMSPAMVATAAITGKITDVRSMI